MKKSKWTSTIAGLTFGTVLFTGCFQPGTGPEDGADISVNSDLAGSSLSAYHKEVNQWEDKYSLNKPSLEGASYAKELQALGKTSPLAKTSLEIGQTTEFDLSDTANGIAKGRVVQTFGDRTSTAEFTIRWNDKARDNIDENEDVIKVSIYSETAKGKVETAVITDADGDGILNPVSGEKNLGNIIITEESDGTTHKIEAVIDAGADLDFDTEGDNKFVSATMSRLVDGELVAQALFADGDGDGYITDNAIEYSEVLVDFYDEQPEDKPHVDKIELDFGMKIYSDGREEPMAMFGKEYWKNGREVKLLIENKDGGTVLQKNDTSYIKLTTVKSGSSDSLESGEITIVMNLGNDLSSEEDDLFYEVHIEGQKKRGIEKKGEFHFWADQPVPRGEDPVAGRFEMSVTYANGEEIELKGEFSENRFTATYTGPAGEIKTVTYTESGDVVTVES